MRDFREAARSLLRTPGYALTVVVVLALGISANIVSFNFYSALALSPVPGVERSADLHVIGARTRGDRVEPLSWHDFGYLRDHLRSYVALAATNIAGFTLGRGPQAVRVYGEMVSGNYFPALGVRAQLGRTLLPSDDVTPRAHPVAVISDRLWRRHFGADPDIVGRTLRLPRTELTIVGVAEPAFHGTVVGIEIELFVPMMMQPDMSAGWDALSRPEAPLVFALGRPRQGVSLEAARRDARLVAGSLASVRPDDQLVERAAIVPIAESPAGLQTYAGPLVRVMFGTSLLLLVVVCANVSGLVMVRCLGRRAEFAARLALGASRMRIVRIVIAENLMLAIPGTLAGLWMPSMVGSYLLETQLRGTSLPIRVDASADSLTLVGVLIAVAAALGCALWPALKSARLDVIAVMRDDAAATSTGARFRTALVAAQVATALVLLVGTTLSMRSFEAARRADPGFDTTGVATAVVNTGSAAYSPGATFAFFDRLLTDLRGQPGVEAAGLLHYPLLMVSDFGRLEFAIEGHPPSSTEDRRLAFNIASPGHFATLRIPLVAGRDFDADDNPAAEPVAIVNEMMARRFWGSAEAALGRRLQSPAWADGPPQWRTVVGVARDIKYARLNEPPKPYVYLPTTQMYLELMHVHVRTRHRPHEALALLRDRISATGSDVAIVDARMMSELTRLGFSVYDVAARVLGFIGIVAIALATVGLYGLVAYSVRLRAREIGIRMAIGEPRHTVLRRYLGIGARVGVTGIAVGVAVSLVAVRLMASLLFGVASTDPFSLGIASGLVLTLTVAAAAVPAWRASRLDPISVLRGG